MIVIFSKGKCTFPRVKTGQVSLIQRNFKVPTDAQSENKADLSPSLPQQGKISGLKAARTQQQTVYFPVLYSTSTFSAVRFDENPFACRCNTEGRNAEGFQTWYFYLSFSNDVMAVKWLMTSRFRMNYEV